MTAKQCVVWWARFALGLAGGVIDLIADDDPKAETEAEPKEETPTPAATTPPPPPPPNRRQQAQNDIKTLAPIPPAWTVNDVAVALTPILGQTSRRTNKQVEWRCGRPLRTVSVQREGDAVGVTIYDGPSPMTWVLSDRRPLDYAVRGLLWHLAEMDVFPPGASVGLRR